MDLPLSCLLLAWQCIFCFFATRLILSFPTLCTRIDTEHTHTHRRLRSMAVSGGIPKGAFSISCLIKDQSACVCVCVCVCAADLWKAVETHINHLMCLCLAPQPCLELNLLQTDSASHDSPGALPLSQTEWREDYFFNVNLKAHNIEIPPFYFMQNDLSSASVVGKLPDLSLKCVYLLQFESGIYL